MGDNLQIFLFLFLLGAGAIFVIAINVWCIAQRKAKAYSNPPLAPAVKAAWGTSLCSVLVPYVAPIALIIAAYAFHKVKKQNGIDNNRVGLVLAVVNSAWAILSAIFVFTFLFDLLRKQ